MTVYKKNKILFTYVLHTKYVLMRLFDDAYEVHSLRKAKGQSVTQVTQHLNLSNKISVTQQYFIIGIGHWHMDTCAFN